jgi:hypothetical protein
MQEEIVMKHLCAAVVSLFITTLTCNATQIVFQSTFNETSNLVDPVTSAGQPDKIDVMTGNVFYRGGLPGPSNPCTAAGLDVNFGNSTYCLQLANSPDNIFFLVSQMIFSSGTYEVVLHMAGGTADGVVLPNLGSLGSPIQVLANTPFTNYSFFSTFDNSTAHLILQAATAGSGILLDSITVTLEDSSTSPVPEPAGWALTLVSGIALLTLVSYSSRHSQGHR